MYPDLRKPWENWYLQAVQTNNILMDVALKEADRNHEVFENKDVWKRSFSNELGRLSQGIRNS